MTLNATGQASINAESTGEVWIALLHLSNDAWTEDVYLASNNEDVTHQGQVYDAFPFEISEPSQAENGEAPMEFLAGNVTREIVIRMRQAEGPITARMFVILASDPDVIQRGPYTSELSGASYDETQLSGTMTAYPVHEEGWNQTRITAADYPGLF